MSNLFKIAILAAPLMALIFYYVVLQQQKTDVEMKKEDLKFEQEWNRFNQGSVFTSEKDKDYYEKRNQEIAKELEEMQRKEREREEKIEKFEKEFEKNLEDADRKGVRK